jgi:hypothetical protein
LPFESSILRRILENILRIVSLKNLSFDSSIRNKFHSIFRFERYFHSNFFRSHENTDKSSKNSKIMPFESIFENKIDSNLWFETKVDSIYWFERKKVRIFGFEGFWIRKAILITWFLENELTFMLCFHKLIIINWSLMNISLILFMKMNSLLFMKMNSLLFMKMNSLLFMKINSLLFMKFPNFLFHEY